MELFLNSQRRYKWLPLNPSPSEKKKSKNFVMRKIYSKNFGYIYINIVTA